MVNAAQVVIIGGGIIGTSIAYHLARRGMRDVVLLEKDLFLGDGSTGDSVGGVRHQFGNEINIRLTQESVTAIRNFSSEMDYELDFRQAGYLFIALHEEHLAALEKNVALQRSLGVPVEFLSYADMAVRWPELYVGDVVGGTFCPEDGYLDPNGMVQGFAKQARVFGARLLTEVEVTEIEVKRGAVHAVQTTKGRIECRTVVNAAGPYAGQVGEMAGLRLPVTLCKRQVFFARCPEPRWGAMPLVIDLFPPFYFKPESGGGLISLAEAEEQPNLDTNLDRSRLQELVERAVNRIPSLADAKIVRGWAGLRTVTPDQNAILGAIPGIDGFICAVGFSGHGVMHAPAVGKLIAELIIDGETKTLDISELSIERFQHNEPRREAAAV